jgi:hypothetical protein
MPARPARPGRLAACAVLTLAALAGPLLGTSGAGGHIDAPSVAKDGPADLTDVYAFTSPDRPDTVTLVANVRPFQLPGNGLAHYPFATGARHELHVDNDGDGRADTTYRFTFRTQDKRFLGSGPIATSPVTSLRDSSLKLRQTYRLERVRPGERPEVLVEEGPAAPTHAGRTLMPDYGALRRAAVQPLPGGGQALAAQSADSFQADVRVFGLYAAGTVGPVPGWLPAGNPLSALNVNSLVLQLPKKEIALRGDPARNPVVGVWATVSRESSDLGRGLRSQEARYRQVSRHGMPHVNFAFWGSSALGTRAGGPEDRWHTRVPAGDREDAEYMAASLDPVPPRRIEKAQGFPAPPAPRKDIQSLFLRGIGKDNGSRFGMDLNTHALNADAPAAGIVPAEELRLNLNTPVTREPHELGLLGGDPQGFPNGRRPNDVIDTVLVRMLMGEPGGRSAAGLLPKPVLDVRPAPAKARFPYLNLPHAGL